MAEVNPTTSKLTLNANRLSNPIKEFARSEKKKQTTIYCLQQTQQIQRPKQVENKEQKKLYHGKSSEKKPGAALKQTKSVTKIKRDIP